SFTTKQPEFLIHSCLLESITEEFYRVNSSANSIIGSERVDRKIAVGANHFIHPARILLVLKEFSNS
ncbi:hypothetical protein, partial [Luteolibacter pohnpeiensis]|uniref:hypothetical protein n=1 Tax=Luteolibacter pohnpeiensis TaxID=454153 RepID=UPI001F303724